MILIFDRIATNKPARRGRFYFAVVPLFVPGVPVLDVCPSDGLKGARGARVCLHESGRVPDVPGVPVLDVCPSVCLKGARGARVCLHVSGRVPDVPGVPARGARVCLHVSGRVPDVPGVPVLDVCPSVCLKGARGARTYIYYTFVIESLKNQAFYSLCVFSLIFELKSIYFVNYSENFRFFLKIFLFLFGSLK